MNSDFEKFIQKNRKDFDSESPSPQLWDRIGQHLPVKQTAKRFTVRSIYKWTATAAILLLILTSAYFLFIKKDSPEKTIAEVPGPVTDASILAPEYAAEFSKIYQAIEDRQAELNASRIQHPELYEQFLDDLATLDSSYRLLRSKATQSPNRDVIIRAMIQNLQLQAELLNRQLMILQQFKNSKKSENETSI